MSQEVALVELRKAYLPVLSSIDYLKSLKSDLGTANSDLKSKMSSNSGRRGRPPKFQKLINDIQSDVMIKDKPNEITNHIKKESDRDSYSINIRTQFTSEIEMIQKKVSLALKTKDLEMEKLVSNSNNLKKVNMLLSDKNKALQLTIIDLEKALVLEKASSKRLEDDKLVVFNDNKALAKRVNMLLSDESNGASKQLEVEKDKRFEAEKKLAKLTEPIEALKKKVLQQENLRSQLNQANGENKSLHMVNEEIRKELSSLNERHQEVIKAKELDESEQISDATLQNSRQILDNENIKIVKARQEVDEQQKTVEEDKLKIQLSRKDLSLENKAIKLKFDEEQKILEEDKKAVVELSLKNNVIKLKLDEEKMILEEEQKAVAEDKIVLDNEWGDIMLKKEEIKQFENHPDKAQVKEKQSEIEKLEAEKKSFLKTINDNEDKLKELHNVIEEKTNVIMKSYEQTIAGLKASNVDIEGSMVALEKDVTKKKIVIEALQNEVSTSSNNLLAAHANLEIRTKQAEESKSQFERMVNSNRGSEKKLQCLQSKIDQNRKVSKTIIKQKNEEIDHLKDKIGQLSSGKKRKQSEEEQEKSKTFKGSGGRAESSNVDLRELSDIVEESRLEEAEKSTPVMEASSNALQKEDYALKTNIVPEVENNFADVPTDEEIGVNTSEDSISINTLNIDDKYDKSSDSSALKLIDNFESFLKNSRNQTQQKVMELTQIVPPSSAIDQSHKKSDILGQVENILEKTSLCSSNNLPSVMQNNTKSIRDIFDDSDDDSENESDLSQPTTSKEGKQVAVVESSQAALSSPVIMSVVPHPPPSITPQPSSNTPLPLISNSPAQTSSKTNPDRPLITLRDINTLSSFLGQNKSQDALVLGDVIIPSFTTNAMDISDDETDREEEAKKVKEDTVKLKFQVAEVVKRCLDRFYKSQDCNYGIKSRKDFEYLAEGLSRQFREDIIAAYLHSNASMVGVHMTQEDKIGILDQIIFHFAVKKEVESHLSKYLPANSTNFIAYSSQYSARFSVEIKESYRTMHNNLVGIELTPDIKQWIGNQIDFSMNSIKN